MELLIAMVASYNCSNVTTIDNNEISCFAYGEYIIIKGNGHIQMSAQSPIPLHGLSWQCTVF